MIGKGSVGCSHAVDVACFCKGQGPMEFPIVPCMVDEWMSLPFSPGKFHPTTSKGNFHAGGDHHCLGYGDISILGKSLSFSLLTCVGSKWEGWFYASDI
jgi:hypothetical protein